MSLGDSYCQLTAEIQPTLLQPLTNSVDSVRWLYSQLIRLLVAVPTAAAVVDDVDNDNGGGNHGTDIRTIRAFWICCNEAERN